MISSLLLLCLPTLALSSMQIYLSGDYDGAKVDLEARYSGSSIEVISDKDMKIFHLNKTALSEAIYKYTKKQPTDFFMRSPTPPFRDLYSQYDWEQIQRTLQPIRASIVSVNSFQENLLRQKFLNTGTKNATYTAEIYQDVKDTIVSHWWKKSEVTFDAKAEYTIDVGVSRAGASTRINYNANWGQDYLQSSTVTVGSRSAIKILLQPGQSAVALLTANRTVVEVELEYEATLSGSLAVNYQDPYKGHHFWSFDINEVCKAGGLNCKVIATEKIKLEYFWNGEITVFDKLTKNFILEVKN